MSSSTKNIYDLLRQIDTGYISPPDGIYNDLIIDGNLTVNGGQTILNTLTTQLEDPIITLNSTGTGLSTEKSGIEIYRGNGNTKQRLIFDDSDDSWKVGLEGYETKLLSTGNLTNGSILYADNTGNLTQNNSDLYYSGVNVGIGTNIPAAKLHIIQNATDGTTDAFRVDDKNSDATYFRIDQAGKVSIQQQDPAAYGNVFQILSTSADPSIMFRVGTAGDGSILIFNSGGNSSGVELKGDPTSTSYFLGNLNIGSNSNNNSSTKLQITSTTQGFLPPVMNSSQKNLIASPTQGLMVYDTDLKKIDVYSNGGWDKGPTLVKILSKQASQSIPAVGSGGLLQIGWDPTYSFSNNWTTSIDDTNTTTRAKIYFPYVGYYQISSNLCFAGSIPAANVANQGYTLYNSSGGIVEQANVQSGNGSADRVRNTASYVLKITDITHYLQLYAYQNTTSAVEIGYTGADKTFICITKL